jgi:hypothetical protein
VDFDRAPCGGALGVTNPKEAQMKLERRNEGNMERDVRDEELQKDRDRDDDRYDTRHSRTLRMQASGPDRENDDPLRGKSDGEILMRYEF